MSATLSFPGDPLEAVRVRLADPDLRRRASGYGVALGLHAIALWALIVLPPAILPEIERASQAIQVRLYTVAGGAEADSDAPLFEPPLAGGADGVEGGADAGSGSGADVSDPMADTLQVQPEEIDESDPAPELVAEEVEPDPAAPVETPNPEAETATAPVSEAGPVPDTRADTPRQADVRTVTPPPAPPRSIQDTREAGPIATTQPDANPGPAVDARPSGPPSFAEILARAGAELDPEDFRLLANFGDGVDATVRENFCLSSVDANREAFDCPEGSYLDAAWLAQFGLMDLGEEPPEFLEDMDRLAFQLSTLGADDSTLARILTGVREARRDAINSGALLRQMERDSRDENGNDVPGAP